MRFAATIASAFALAAPLVAQCALDRIQPAGGASTGDNFGAALDTDGALLAVGAPGETTSRGQTGAAHLFAFDGTSYVPFQSLEPIDGMLNDRFGASVAIEGTTCAVGADTADGAFVGSGAVYVHEVVFGVWLAMARLQGPTGSVLDQFGYALALEGDTLVVGAPREGTAGAVHVFERVGGVWTWSQKLVAFGPSGSQEFGFDVALSGGTILVGARWDYALGPSSGAAYAFRRSGSSFGASQVLLASDGGQNDQFGYSVALAGTRALIGAVNFSAPTATLAGKAFVFDVVAGAFVETAGFLAPDASNSANFGSDVALSADASWGAVGAMSDSSGLQLAGSTYTYLGASGAPLYAGKLTSVAPGSFDRFGLRTAIEGGTLFVAAPHDGFGGANAGAVYAYPLAGPRCPEVVATSSSLSVLGGGTARMDYAPGVASAARGYVVLASASGTTGGPFVDGVTIPLRPDAWFWFTVNAPGQAPYAGSAGLLDAAGSGGAWLTAPPGGDPALVGRTLHHSFVEWDPFTGTVLDASAPFALSLGV